MKPFLITILLVHGFGLVMQAAQIWRRGMQKPRQQTAAFLLSVVLTVWAAVLLFTT